MKNMKKRLLSTVLLVLSVQLISVPVSAGSNSGKSNEHNCSVSISNTSCNMTVVGSYVTGSGDYTFYEGDFSNNVGVGASYMSYWTASATWSNEFRGWRARVWQGGCSSGEAKVDAYN